MYGALLISLCVLTTSHLINKLPTPILGNLTPYDVLLGRKPDYNKLKIFGCLAFVANPNSVRDKMVPRGVPYLFLGYP